MLFGRRQGLLPAAVSNKIVVVRAALSVTLISEKGTIVDALKKCAPTMLRILGRNLVRHQIER